MVARIPEEESFGHMRRDSEELWRHVNDLSRTDGAQYARALEKIKALIAGLDAQVAAAIETNSYTRAQIDAKRWGADRIDGVLAPGNGGSGTTNAANNTFTSGGPWNVIYGKTATGELGHAPSLRDLKQDIEPAFGESDIDPAALLDFPVLTYRFKDDVAERGNEAIPQFGLIAEDLEDSGFEPLLIRDGEGVLFGIAYDRIWMMHHEILRAQQSRIDVLERRLTALEGDSNGSV